MTDPIRISGDGSFGLEVVGESYYQDNLEKICGPRSEDGENRVVDALLICDNNNTYDQNAVKVEIDGLQVGYLSKEVAPDYRKAIKASGHAGETMICKAKITGGWKRKGKGTGHYGVRLDVRAQLVEDDDEEDELEKAQRARAAYVASATAASKPTQSIPLWLILVGLIVLAVFIAMAFGPK